MVKEAEKAISEMTGKLLGSRTIRCNWATKNSAGHQVEDTQNVALSANPSTVSEQTVTASLPNKQDGVHEEQHEEAAAQGDGPESNPQYTTVYVGNLAHEVTQAELHRQFHALGAGVIEDVRVQRDKGFGFVRYRTHDEASYAIQVANGRVICGKSIKCSWGNKPTLPGTSSAPLPPPLPLALPFAGVMTAGLNQGYNAADLLAYQRQWSLTQAGGQALLPLPQQGGGMGGSLPVATAGARSVFDGFQPGTGMPSASALAAAAAMGQQHIFY
ncbi:hypothetical protein O6H91_04G116900 [Diphasiastrum complanatum]|uniref:Uncharacterized protein n=1 Tax=Diphasiastrum complanatum TaxID=34168 RepID=A0ACC2E167_DIPCM|nr:hypothetical protein O6H91_04G116900 [Diphasiastrum complanatum]